MSFDEFLGLTILFFVLRGVWRGFDAGVYYAASSEWESDITVGFDPAIPAVVYHTNEWVKVFPLGVDDEPEMSTAVTMATRKNFKQMYSRF